MGVGPTASARKMSGGLQKYRKAVDHRKREVVLERGVAKWCRDMQLTMAITMNTIV